RAGARKTDWTPQRNSSGLGPSPATEAHRQRYATWQYRCRARRNPGCLTADGLVSDGLTSAALRSGQVSGRNRQMRLALVSSKGGTGKTTSAVSLAMVLHRGGRTLAVDCDPQGSLMNWSETAAEEGHSLPFTV